MFSRLVEVMGRVRYELERIKKVGPTLVRFGISQLEDAVRRLMDQRSSCDHVRARGQATRRNPKRGKPKPRKPRKSK